MTDGATSVEAERRQFYDEIAVQSLAPLWEHLHALVPKTPATPALPVHWDYDGVVRSHVLRAGEIVTAAEAERRVLILENPGLQGRASITHSLYAGLQLVKPGEVAPAHRHTQSALRFVIEGRGAYTSVDGERTLMRPGDFVLTPSWRWHDHGNESDEPMVWLDGLDIPILAFFDAGFAETAATASQVETRPVGDSAARYGNNMLPVDWAAQDRSSPILNYPYERSCESLEALARNGDPDPCHGHKLRFVNPATGGSPMPTIAAFIQMLPTGFSTEPYRSTDGTVFVVVEGHGDSHIGDMRFEWKPRDIFVAPSWLPITHHCRGQATLFSFSDRSVQEQLGIWREARGAEEANA
jgi:gentisate 1,2-dioxygenase